MGKYIHWTKTKVNKLIHHSKTQVRDFWLRGMEAACEQNKSARFVDADLICLPSWNMFLCSFPFIYRNWNIPSKRCCSPLKSHLMFSPFCLETCWKYTIHIIIYVIFNLFQLYIFDRFIYIYFSPSSTGHSELAQVLPLSWSYQDTRTAK